MINATENDIGRRVVDPFGSLGTLKRVLEGHGVVYVLWDYQQPQEAAQAAAEGRLSWADGKPHDPTLKWPHNVFTEPQEADEDDSDDSDGEGLKPVAEAVMTAMNVIASAYEANSSDTSNDEFSGRR